MARKYLSNSFSKWALGYLILVAMCLSSRPNMFHGANDFEMARFHATNNRKEGKVSSQSSQAAPAKLPIYEPMCITNKAAPRKCNGRARGAVRDAQP
jgi:hypothetical protein